MKKFIIIVLSFFSFCLYTYSQEDKISEKKLDTHIPTDKEFSEAIGVYFGSFLKENVKDLPGSENVDYKILLKSLQSTIEKETPKDVEKRAYEKIEAYITQKQKEQNEVTKEAGEKFLALNASKKGVKTTKSGLQYMIISEGQGPRATVEDTVTIHYKGMLIDGKEFDSSYQKEKPAKFSPLQVIPGWTEGLCLLKEGTKARLFIPYQLAYGERGVGKKIPPYSTLIFDVEILKVTKGKPIPIAEARPTEDNQKK